MPVLLVGAMSLSFVLYVWGQQENRYAQDRQADFSYETREITLRLQERLASYRQILRGGRSLLAAHGRVTFEQWRSFTKNLFLSNEYPGLSGLGLAAAITADNKEQHIGRVQKNGVPEYAIYPDTAASRYAPIIRLASTIETDSKLFGFNLLTLPEFATVMEKAENSKENTLSSPFYFADTSSPAAKLNGNIFMFQPIFELKTADVPDETAGEKIPTLHGWVFIFFRMQDVLQEVIKIEESNFNLKIFSKENNALIPTLDYASHQFPNSRFKQSFEISVDNQTYLLEYEGYPRNYKPLGFISGEKLVTLLLGILITLGSFFVISAKRHNMELLALTSELRESEERQRFMATHDNLTGTANRGLLLSVLDSTLAEAERYHLQFALIFIDLDKFKNVNDTYGHHAGDELLLQVTQRISSAIRKSDLLARNGGDEFIVLLPLVEKTSDVTHVAEKICQILAQPFLLETCQANIAGSLGLAVYPNDGLSSKALVEVADMRMYKAKQAGGNRWVGEEA